MREQKLIVIFREFTSSEDGQLFISRLEGIPTKLLEKVSDSANWAAAATISLLAVIRPDRTATVYHNEAFPTVHIRAKGKVNKGDLVTLDHILDLDRVSFPGISIPNDAGICYVFSFGWRKGLYFDFGPLFTGNDRQLREYDLEQALGQCLAQLHFQHLFAMSEQTWDEMYSQGWFPFSHLPSERVKTMIGRAKEKILIDAEIVAISDETAKEIKKRIEDWVANALLAPQLPFIRAAFKRFGAGDYLEASCILYPRLEGIMRAQQLNTATQTSASQSNLAAIASGVGHPALVNSSLLMPHRFRRYLNDVFFASFDPVSPPFTVSRNSVSHGVIEAGQLDRKAATIGFLILLQISSVAHVTGSSVTITLHS